MRYQPERALKHLLFDNREVFDHKRRNEISAREGIETIHRTFEASSGFSVEMRYQPERALKLILTLYCSISPLQGRNEISAREGIETFIIVLSGLPLPPCRNEISAREGIETRSAATA